MLSLTNFVFGADTDKVAYYKITNDFVSKTLLVPKNYFDKICQNGKERKWVFGLSEGVEIVGLDFMLLKNHNYNSGNDQDTFKVQCMMWSPHAI
jgi:hypothetical protein